MISTTTRTLLFLRHKSALDEQAETAEPITGELVLYDHQRCLRLQTGQAPSAVTLLWPFDWSMRLEDVQAVILDGAGQHVACLGDQVRVNGRRVPHTWESEVDRRLVSELPGDCCCSTWLVEGVEHVE